MEEEEEGLQPLPVDSWEICPDCIIMDTMLGEGQFGEVYKGLIKNGDVNNPYFKGSECVAVKILRREWCCRCCVCVYACLCERSFDAMTVLAIVCFGICR